MSQAERETDVFISLVSSLGPRSQGWQNLETTTDRGYLCSIRYSLSVDGEYMHDTWVTDYGTPRRALIRCSLRSSGFRQLSKLSVLPYLLGPSAPFIGAAIRRKRRRARSCNTSFVFDLISRFQNQVAGLITVAFKRLQRVQCKAIIDIDHVSTIGSA